MELLNQIVLGLFISIIIILLIRMKRRGFFWEDRGGKELSGKQFMGRWKDGIINITPIQQTQTTLWSMIPIFAGLLWGITATFLIGTYWLTLILTGSLPITSIQFIANIQKYRAQKKAKEMMDEAMGIKPEPKKRKKKK